MYIATSFDIFLSKRVNKIAGFGINQLTHKKFKPHIIERRERGKIVQAVPCAAAKSIVVLLKEPREICSSSKRALVFTENGAER